MKRKQEQPQQGFVVGTEERQKGNTDRQKGITDMIILNIADYFTVIIVSRITTYCNWIRRDHKLYTATVHSRLQH
jgi:hypothetical protein